MKHKWNINIHWRVAKLHTMVIHLEHCWLPEFPLPCVCFLPQSDAYRYELDCGSICVSSSSVIPDTCPNQFRHITIVKQTSSLRNFGSSLIWAHTYNRQPANIHNKRQVQNKKTKLQSGGHANTDFILKHPSWWSLAELKVWKTVQKADLNTCQICCSMISFNLSSSSRPSIWQINSH